MTDETVYSTDPDFCPACRASPCVCADRKKRRQPQPVRLSFHRACKGSGVTLIEGIILHPRLKEDLLRSFKKRLGCGGTIKGGALELQGDRRDFVQNELQAEGYQVKRVGG
jgi:translation initiation factor 1